MDEYEFKIHTVQKGDSYSKLCKGDPKCLKLIQKANRYKATAIPIGAELKVPVKKEKKPITVAEKIKEVKKKEKPKNIESTKCCCKVAPWTVKEEGRSYVLKVTKVGKDAEGNKVLLLEEKSNLKENQYELHIVAKEYKDGKSQDKEIVVEHEFFMKKCPLTMSLLTKSSKLDIADGIFEIDSNGNVKNKLFSMIVPPVNEKSVIQEKPQMVYIDGLENTTEGAWREESIFVNDNLEEVAPEEELSELEIIIKSIFSPRDAAKKFTIHPTGDDSCKTQETVHLYVSPATKFSGTVRVNYTAERKQPMSQSDYGNPKVLSNQRFEITTGKWELSFNIKGNYGDKKLNLGQSISGGGDEHTRSYTPEERKKVQKMEKNLGRNKKHLLGRVEKIMNFFLDTDAKNRRYADKLQNNNRDKEIKNLNDTNRENKESLKKEFQESRKGIQGEALKTLEKQYALKKEKLEKEHLKEMDKAHLRCKDYFPIFTFNPGTTGFMLGITDYKLKEKDDDYTVDTLYNVLLKINLLSGAELKIDILSLLIARAGGKAEKTLREIRYDACVGVQSKNVSAKIEPVVELSLIGGGTLDFTIKKLEGNPLNIEKAISTKDKGTPTTFEGSGSVKLGLIAKVSLKFEAKFYFVTVSGEMGATLASVKNQSIPAGYTFTLGYFYDKKRKAGCWKGGAVFSGMALYYVLKGAIDIELIDSSSSANNQGMALPSKLSSSGEWSGHYTIFKADKKKDVLSECIDMPSFLT